MNNDEIKGILNESKLRMLGMHAFEAGDPNKTGFINLETLLKLIKEFAEGTNHSPPSQEFIDKIVKTMNKSSNDKFSIDDFITFFKAYLEQLLK